MAHWRGPQLDDRPCYRFACRAAADVGGARSGRQPACSSSGSAGDRAIPFRSKRLMRIHRTRWQRLKRVHRASRNRHLRVLVSRRKARVCKHHVPVHRDHRYRPMTDRSMRRQRPRNRPVANRCNPDVGTAIKAHSPPRRAAAHSRRPAPAEVVVEVPRSTLERHVSPRVA